jgi:hypothetical protein
MHKRGSTVHCCDSTSNCEDFDGVDKPGELPLTPTPSENSRYTPRCPSVVLWMPCSGVEWGAFVRTDHQGQAARRASSLRT